MKSWASSGTRSMEPHNNHIISNEESTMSNTLPDLSNLPDLVLVSILSFMDAKEAVQTCILSKRWRNLWNCIPSLNFDRESFKGTNAAFVHFISSMLSLRGSSKLDTFRLSWRASQDNANTDSEEIRKTHGIAANAWINYALSCKPLVISLDLHGFDNSKLPPALFRCASLKQLELHLSWRSRGETREYKYVNLPSLKKLKFSRFIINDPFMQGISSGCPLLEELEFCDCSLNVSEMKSDHLRCLNIIACQGSRVVEIFMPSLVSLQFKNFYPGLKKLSFKSTPSLVKVFIWCDFSSGAEVELFNCSDTVTELGLFGSDAEGLLQKIVLKCPIFDSLKQLTVGQWSINEKLDLLCQFLQLTPNLEKLTIVDKEDIVSCFKRQTWTGKAEEKGATGRIPFRCDQLKVIEIKYSDLTGVLELVNTLLRNISRQSVSVVYTRLRMW